MIVFVGVLNYRPVSELSGRVFRSACLDNISVSAAEELLQGSSLACIIDLRNSDEIAKGVKNRSAGANILYSKLRPVVGLGISEKDFHPGRPNLYHVPLLGDVDAFWEETISRMPSAARLQGTLATIVQGGALDRAASRHLEHGGLPLLYGVMMRSNPKAHARVLKVVAKEAARGVVLLHCQKGKDRTGVAAALLQSCLGEPACTIVSSYAASGPLLGEDVGLDSPSGARAGSGLDWSRFRGSPAVAMERTLGFVRNEYGSLESYLDFTGFGSLERGSLKRALSKPLEGG